MNLYSIAQHRNEPLTHLIQKHQSDGFFLTYEPKSAKGKWYKPAQRPDRAPRLLILDSSFNPPTKAHSALLKKALDTRPGYFDASLLLFSTQNADKQLTGASVVKRAQMMEIMARRHESQDHPLYVGLTTWAKFIDKATEIQKWYCEQQQGNQHLGMELYFILGHDTVTRLLDPKYYEPMPVAKALEPFFENCYLICADRPGYTKTDDEDGLWNTPLVHTYANRITRISLADQGAVASISSTLARQATARILSGDGDRYTLLDFLDDPMVDFVLGEQIYQ